MTSSKKSTAALLCVHDAIAGVHDAIEAFDDAIDRT